MRHSASVSEAINADRDHACIVKSLDFYCGFEQARLLKLTFANPPAQADYKLRYCESYKIGMLHMIL